MSKHTHREYQQEIEDAVIDYLFNKEGNPIVAAPGGVGKSFVMAKLIKRFLTEWPGTRVIVLAQDAKLLRQERHSPAVSSPAKDRVAGDFLPDQT